MLYFDGERLKEWSRQSQQTMASFEKIRTVGKGRIKILIIYRTGLVNNILHWHPAGAHGAAVLYRRKDDDSLVVLKEINLLGLTKAERTAALNEVSTF